MCLWEIDGTMFCRTASRANSFGVQCVTGIPNAFGSLQASAMICVSCSAENFAGTPGRSSSARTSSNTASNSWSVVSACAATSNRGVSSANLLRHRFTRCLSTPNLRACSIVVFPSADQSTICTLSASRRSNFRVRLSRSRMGRTRSFSVMGRACRDMLPTMIFCASSGNRCVTSATVY